MSTHEQLIKQYVRDATTRKWTDAQILALSPKLRGELSRFATKDGKPIGKTSPELLELIERRGFMPADGRAALTLVQDKTINPMTQANSEWIASKGGNETFTTEKSTLYMCNGDKVVRPLTPIPANPARPDKYDNLDVVTAFCGTLVAHTDGVWSNSNEQAWVKVFPSLSASGVNDVACLVSRVLNDDEKWISLPQTARASITGRNGAVFIRDCLNGLSTALYNYLNTKIVVDAFGALIQAADGSWEIDCDETGKERVPTKMYTVLPKTDLDIQFSAQYPATFLYRGGWVPLGRMTKTDAKQTGSVLAARQKLIDTAKGDSAIPSLIAKSNGFSGITTEAAKIHYFLLSATIECWRRGKVANIRLTKDGDITLLYAALSYWQKKAEGDDRFTSMNAYEGSWFYFLTAKRNAHLNVAVEVKELIISNHQESAVAVTYLNDTIKTKVDKTADPVNHDTASGFVLPMDLPRDYIVKCPIYGTAFFPLDSSLVRQKKKGTTKADLGKQYDSVKVYAHGNASDFYGIASSLEDLCLVGAEPAKEGLKLTPLSLVRFETREAWYGQVSKDITAVYQAVFSPKKTYSCITNLLVITKGKVTILADINGDDARSAPYAGKVFARGGYERKKFVLPVAGPSTTSGATSVLTSTTSKAAPTSSSGLIDTMGPPPEKKKAFVPPPQVLPPPVVFTVPAHMAAKLLDVRKSDEKEVSSSPVGVSDEDEDLEEEDGEDGEEGDGDADPADEDEEDEEDDENLVDLND